MRVFGFPDIHFPNHDDEALRVAMLAHKMFKPDITVLGGDMADCSPFSRWAPQTMHEAIAYDWKDHEIKAVNNFLDEITPQTGKIYWVPGNHDKWPERWAAGAGRLGQSIYSLISLKENALRGRANVFWCDADFFSLSDKLVVIHGWSCALHAAARHLQLSSSKSIIFNHTHRKQMDTITDPWTGEPREAMSAGCLCRRVPIWSHSGEPTKWIHGFWVAYIGKDSHTIYPVTIYKGEAIMPDGRQVRL